MPRVNEEHMPSPIEALCAENNKLRQQRAELLEALKAVRQWHDSVWMTNMPIDLQELVKSTITKAEAAE